ncbi:MAG: hemerythrin family protein [Sedimenticola sp.]
MVTQGHLFSMVIIIGFAVGRMMEAEDWFEKYRIGVPLIDADHRSLFDEVYKLRDNLNNEIDLVQMGQSIQFLYQYVGAHFAREEQLMREKHYPRYAHHKAAHHHLRRVVFAVQKIYRETPERVDKGKLEKFLEFWLTEHIQGMDMELEPYINGPLSHGGVQIKHQATPLEEEVSPLTEVIEVTLRVPGNKAEILERCAKILLQSTPEAQDLEELATATIGITMTEAEELAVAVLVSPNASDTSEKGSA